MTLGVMALAHLFVTGVAYLVGLAEDASVLDLLGLTAMFAGGFAVASWCFHRSAGQQSLTPTGRP